MLKEAGAIVGHARSRRATRRRAAEQVAIRLSPEVLTALRATGPGWQLRIDEALKDWLKGHAPA